MKGSSITFYTHCLPWSLALGLTTGVLCFVPLLQVLGYESSLILSLLASLMGGHIGAHIGAQVHPSSRSRVVSESWDIPWRAWFKGNALTLIPLLPPLLLLLLNAFRVQNCNLLQGVAFYLLLPVLSAFVAVGWGTACSALTGSSRLGFMIVLCLGLVSVVMALARLYMEPQVMAYGPTFGYWAGVLYDENISISWSLIWARLFHLSSAGLALALVSIVAPLPGVRLRMGKLAPLFLASLMVVSLYTSGTGLGFRRDKGFVVQKLGGRTQTPHFTIYHPDSLSQEELSSLADDLEFRLDQTSRYFGLTPRVPEHCDTIEAFIYQNVEERLNLVGLGHTSLAKPWSCQVHLIRPYPGDSVVAHEIAHVVTASMARGPLYISTKFRVLPLMALVEGAAESATFQRGALDHHGQAAVMLHLGLLPNLSQLFDGVQFWKEPPARAYTAAGSFVRFLIEQEGTRRFAAAYRSGSLQLVYRTSIDNLIERWTNHLKTIQLDEVDIREAEARFRRQSIFSKVCPHESAKVRGEAQQALRAGDVDRAVDLYSRLCLLLPHQAENQLALANALAQGHYLDGAKEVAGRVFSIQSATPINRANALRLLGDLAWRGDDIHTALGFFTQAEEEAGRGPFQRTIRARIAAIQLEQERDTIHGILDGTNREPDLAMLQLAEITWSRPDHGLAPYLLGRRLYFRRRPHQAIPYLERAVEKGAGDPILLVEARQLLGQARYAAGDFQGAMAVFEGIMSENETMGQQTGASDWRQRCRWRMARGSKLLESCCDEPDHSEDSP